MNYLNNKKMILASVIACVSLQAHADDIAIAKSSFWQAPFRTSMQVSLINPKSSLIKECEEFKKDIFAADGSVKVSANSADTLRQLSSDDSMEDSFSAVFILGNSVATDLVADIPTTALSSIPYYNQTSSHSEVITSSLFGFKSSYGAGSLQAVSASLGLQILPIHLIYVAGKVALKVDGRDTACDIVNHATIIRAQGTVQVQLPQKSQIALNEFYSSVESQSLSVLSLDEGKFSKAARLGFRLSQLISPTSGYSVEVEKSTLALFKLLFGENTLEPSFVWSRFDGKNSLVVFGTSVKEPVTVELLN
ncbi:MAG TPA: hypothetical protein VF412_10335 [Bdellovibrio sp.]|uniref:hypothetical protein n=1 Tax=Bdellovibrio sp. TaxID=28201 RepID=UPI002EE425EC